MKRATQLAILATLAAAGAWGQAIGTVKIGTNPEGPYFYVDGRQYTTTQVFLWPVGSKHQVQFPLSVDPATTETLQFQYGRNSNIRYTFGGWKTNGPALANPGATEQTVTASSGIYELIGTVSENHKVRFQFYASAIGDGNCTMSPGDPTQDGIRNGIIYVDGTCIGGTKEVFMVAGEHTLNAYPYPGFVFAGWFMNGQQTDPYLSKFNLQSSVQIIPQFMPAKRVRFASEPTGLKIIVDSSVIQLPPGRPRDQLPNTNIDSYCAPDFSKLPPNPPQGITPLCIGDFDFLPGSIHRLGAPLSQTDDAGLAWVFSSFSNGVKNNETYIPDGLVGTAESIVARFVPGVPATFLTSPPGLKMEVDGRQNWPNYNFMWGAGEKHTIRALATQVDSRGRRYRFIGWSNTRDEMQEVTVPNDRSGFSMTANYQVLGQVQVISTPVGLKLNLDGVECTTPCTLDRDSGVEVLLSTPQTVPTNSFARYDFDNWTDGDASLARTITFSTDVQVLRANYHRSFLLVANSDPPGQVAFKFEPASPDGFFAEGTQVTVTATTKGGFKFRRWDGDLAGTFSTGYLPMSSPREIIARLDKVPFIAAAGIKNAAGETPENTVAPGSLIAIYGENLAAALEIGPTNPLAQTLGNVTVQVSDRLLPLLFVSAKQINAQVPSDLPDGDYTLRVRSSVAEDVTGKFTIRRNSPGIYTQANEQNAPLALALHEDGTPVTADSPARRRETIQIFGTGFGPYEQRVIDGFLVPASPQYRLADAVSVVAGDVVLSPQWTGAAPGMVGTTLMKLRISDEMPAASTLDVVVQVNGVQSNKVILPVE